LTSEAAMIYLPEVEDIIASGCKDQRRIEVLLDRVLDFCWTKPCLDYLKNFVDTITILMPGLLLNMCMPTRNVDEESLDKRGET